MAPCAGREDGGAAMWGCSPGLGSPLLPQASARRWCWPFISSYWVTGRGWAGVLVCVITPVALSEGKRVISIFSASPQCYSSSGGEGPFHADSNGVCVFLKHRFVFAMQARKSELKNA